jgi:hypothetical protein
VASRTQTTHTVTALKVELKLDFSEIFRFFCLFLIFFRDEREEELSGGVRKMPNPFSKEGCGRWWRKHLFFLLSQGRIKSKG